MQIGEMNYSAVELRSIPSGKFFSKHSSPQQAVRYSASKISILGVKVNRIEMDQTVALILSWTKVKGKRYVVTTNIEFIMAAQKNLKFKEILNKADLSIPDSARFSWAYQMQKSSQLKKLLLMPFFPISNLIWIEKFPVVTGTDLIDQLCKKGGKLKIGFLGGLGDVAKLSAVQLKSKYPDIEIVFVDSGGTVGEDYKLSAEIQTQLKKIDADVLFVAFGQIKQEIWITKNMDKVDAKVFIGVGGAFDYYSGKIIRAPKFLRNLGLEYLFRLIIQPWRIKRFFSLIKFVFLVFKNGEVSNREVSSVKT